MILFSHPGSDFSMPKVLYRQKLIRLLQATYTCQGWLTEHVSNLAHQKQWTEMTATSEGQDDTVGRTGSTGALTLQPNGDSWGMVACGAATAWPGYYKLLLFKSWLCFTHKTVQFVECKRSTRYFNRVIWLPQCLETLYWLGVEDWKSDFEFTGSFQSTSHFIFCTLVG